MAAASRTTPPTIVDESVLLRYLLNDDTRKSAQAHRIILEGNVCVYPETIVRTVEILSSVYSIPHSLIGHVVCLLLDDVIAEEDAELRLAAHLYGDSRHDFRTCLMLARSTMRNQRAFSFDPATARALSSRS